MTRAYERLLQIYPPEYLEAFADEMMEAFDEALQECRRQSAASLLSFLLMELFSILKSAMSEWVARLTYSLYHSSSYVSRSCRANRLLMRPAGVARESYFVETTAGVSDAALIDDSGMCVNVHQRFVSASPLRRLLMLICTMFVPIHRS
jgi:hypothetical protein